MTSGQSSLSGLVRGGGPWLAGGCGDRCRRAGDTHTYTASQACTLALALGLACALTHKHARPQKEITVKYTFSQLRDELSRISHLGATASKKKRLNLKGGMGGGTTSTTIAGERQRVPRTVGCPRPRVQVTWAGERAAHGLTKRKKSKSGDEIESDENYDKCVVSSEAPALTLRGALQKQSRRQSVRVASTFSLSSSNPPPSPFSSYLSS